mmetsp:Transcript_8835/g.7895  ORF Transcript_8835/g.7895 Transcript_8835/m.7895 type:complete len:141 (-) Transcript_8835:129-551(-)
MRMNQITSGFRRLKSLSNFNGSNDSNDNNTTALNKQKLTKKQVSFSSNNTVTVLPVDVKCNSTSTSQTSSCDSQDSVNSLYVDQNQKVNSEVKNDNQDNKYDIKNDKKHPKKRKHKPKKDYPILISNCQEMSCTDGCTMS